MRRPIKAESIKPRYVLDGQFLTLALAGIIMRVPHLGAEFGEGLVHGNRHVDVAMRLLEQLQVLNSFVECLVLASWLWCLLLLLLLSLPSELLLLLLLLPSVLLLLLLLRFLLSLPRFLLVLLSLPRFLLSLPPSSLSFFCCRASSFLLPHFLLLPVILLLLSLPRILLFPVILLLLSLPHILLLPVILLLLSLPRFLPLPVIFLLLLLPRILLLPVLLLISIPRILLLPVILLLSLIAFLEGFRFKPVNFHLQIFFLLTGIIR